MIDLTWLSKQLCEVLRWQLANPDGQDDPRAPAIPWAGARLWRMFIDLNNTRGSSGFGPSPLSNAEIESYGRLHREPLRLFEMEILREMDRTFLEAVSKRAQPPETPQTPPDHKDIFAAFRAAASEGRR